VITPVCASTIGTMTATVMFESWYLGWTWGVAMGAPVGAVVGLLVGIVPARGNMTLFALCCCGTTLLASLPPAMMQIAPLLLWGSIPLGCLLGTALYFSLIDSRTGPNNSPNDQASDTPT